MAGSRNPAEAAVRRLGFLLILGPLSLAGGRANAEVLLPGASPGERAAIVAYCAGAGDSAMAQNMCQTNQLTTILRMGRKPDLSVASPDQRSVVRQACGSKKVPGERFACERAELARAGLTVRNEAGGGQLHADLAAAPGTAQSLLKTQPSDALPFFSLVKWRTERPAMPPAKYSPVLPAESLYEKLAPSLYIVMASDHAIELAERTGYSQGSAVAITDHILITNCHVVAGRPQISVSQDGGTNRATLIYADAGGDRCFLRVDGITLHPIQGVRKLDDIRIGETVYSLGAPIGLERSFGNGIVSGLRQWEGVRVVQNSAPTWHGSSGGGLFDARGNLVGITTAISSITANMNFSIAAEDFWP
jgi:S1-C subfamily serine protease